MGALVVLSLLMLAPADQALLQAPPQTGEVELASAPNGKPGVSPDSQAAIIDPEMLLDVTSGVPENDADNICYKIRAFIFERDDDHAPKLVRETTCVRARPRAKSVEGFVPRLVPATGPR